MKRWMITTLQFHITDLDTVLSAISLHRCQGTAVLLYKKVHNVTLPIGQETCKKENMTYIDFRRGC